MDDAVTSGNERIDDKSLRAAQAVKAVELFRLRQKRQNMVGVENKA
jgi:hypothetical protein